MKFFLAISITLFFPHTVAQISDSKSGRFCKEDRRSLALQRNTSKRGKRSLSQHAIEDNREKRLQERKERRLEGKTNEYDHEVIDVYPIGGTTPELQREYVIDKLNDAKNGDTVLFQPAHYVVNAKICPFDDDAFENPTYTIKGAGESPSDTVLYGMEFVCKRNFIVLENIEVWGSMGNVCESNDSYDYDATLIFRNSVVRTFGKPFDLLSHQVHFIKSEYINMLPKSSDGIIDNDGNGVVVMKSKFVGFDAAIYFGKDPSLDPSSGKGLLSKIYENNFKEVCTDCAHCDGFSSLPDCPRGCSTLFESVELNTPKGEGIVVKNFMDILRHPFPLPIGKITFKKVKTAGETTVYRIPNGYSMLNVPSGYYPVYTDAAHAYQFDSTAVLKKSVAISFKRSKVFGKSCTKVEFFYYRAGMDEWMSLKEKTETSNQLYTVTLSQNKIPLDGTIVAAFIPEVEPEDNCS